MDLEQLVPERYRVKYNQENGTFSVLDTWHQSIKNLNLESNPEIPDDSPSMKHFSTEEVNSIVGELIKLGWLDKMIEAKVGDKQFFQTTPTPRKPTTIELIIEKIAEITLDDGSKPEPHSSVSKDSISALKEIASRL